MKENRLQISPTIPSLVDDGDLADDEISIDDQEPSLPSRSEMFVENSQESSFFPPSEPSLPSSVPAPDPEINDTLMSLLTDNNFDVTVQVQVSPPPSSSPPSSPSSPSSLPEPVFDVSEVTLKTGRNKGKTVKRISMILGNHVFKRNKKMANGKMIFTCNSCEKQNHYLSAVVGTEDEEASKYFLIRAPPISKHSCWVSSNQQAIKEAKEEMYQKVLSEPTRSLQEIYETVRQKFTAELDPSSKLIFLQDFPKFLDIKKQLLSRRREMIPPDPKAMSDIDFSLPVFLTKNGENVVKGEQVLSDGRRVILFTTNEHLKILARAHQILGDGTFRITPGLWCQTFIISAEVSSGVFVPVCFCLLPDKKKESYEVMFSLLKECLESSGLELSAAYFMSDFEVAIRDAFQGTFQGIEAKGCAFHFSKAVLSKIARSGFKGDYQSSAEFSCLVRAIFGLAYVPLERLAEALRNLYVLAKRLNDRQAKFAVVLINYVERTWVNGSFPPETWNMFKHDGETTNNRSEGYNFRLGNKRTISKHPNFFQFCETVKLELGISHDEAIAAEAGAPNTRYRHPQDKRNMGMRKRLMVDLQEGKTSLISFQQAIGGSLSRSQRVVEVDGDDEPLPISGRTAVIIVPSLEEIRVSRILWFNQ